MFTGTGFAQPEDRQPAEYRQQRQQDRADRVDVDQRIEGHAAEQARGRIAEAIGRPRVRSLVDRQRDDHDCEADQNRRKLQRDG